MSVTTANDEEFYNYKELWKTTIQAIVLPQDINAITGQVILAKLDEVYAYLRVDLGELEAAKDRAESIVRQNERSKAVGKNEDDRKKNATEFLENFPVGDNDTINMYDYFRLLDSRYKIVKSLVDIISNKQQRLITMNGFLKVDSSLGNNY